jgi:thioredoxin 2
MTLLMADKPFHIVCPNCAAINRIAAGLDATKAKCAKCHTKLFHGKSWPTTRKTFEKQITRNDIPVVVDFWADWCAPCKVMAPEYEKLAVDLEPDFRLLKLDTEAEPEIAARYGIRSIPTLIMYLHGQEVARRVGASDRKALKSWITEQRTTA